MPSYRELLQQVKSEIDECTPREAAARSDEPAFLDVRERDEWEEGTSPAPSGSRAGTSRAESSRRCPTATGP